MNIKFKSLNQHERKELIKLLYEAAILMLEGGDSPIWTIYGTAEKFGHAIEAYAQKIERDEDGFLLELWNIFAPTCDWDDSGGSVTLGNQIFEFLEKLQIK